MQSSSPVEQSVDLDLAASLHTAIVKDPSWSYTDLPQQRQDILSSETLKKTKNVSPEEFNGLVDLLSDATKATNFFSDVRYRSALDGNYAGLVQLAATAAGLATTSAQTLDDLRMEQRAGKASGIPDERKIAHYRKLIDDSYDSFKPMYKNASQNTKKEDQQEYKNPVTMNGNLRDFAVTVLNLASQAGYLGLDYNQYVNDVKALLDASTNYQEYVGRLIRYESPVSSLEDVVSFATLGIATQKILVHLFSLYTAVVPGAMNDDGRYVPTDVFNILLGKGTEQEAVMTRALREASQSSQRSASSATKKTVGGLTYKPFVFNSFDDYSFSFIHFSQIVNAVDGKLPFDVDSFFESISGINSVVAYTQDESWGDSVADVLSSGPRLRAIKDALASPATLKKFLSQTVTNPLKGQSPVEHDVYLLSHWLGSTLWLDDMQLKGTMTKTSLIKKETQKAKAKERAELKKREVFRQLGGKEGPTALATSIRERFARQRSSSPSRRTSPPRSPSPTRSTSPPRSPSPTS